LVWPIDFSDVVKARERLQPYLSPTPLRSYAPLDEALGLHVLVKHENHNPTNCFKIRNGLSALTALTPEERRRGVITATRGNHGQGLAWAGRKLNVPITVCVPLRNNIEKNEAIRGFGAELIEEGRDYDESVEVMNRIARERGLRTIHSTNEAWVIAGAATLSLEMLEQADAMGKALDAAMYAVGGGSQAVGAMTVFRKLRPTVAVYGVQAEKASAIYDSWKAGKPVTHQSADTIADGVATKMSYAMTFDALRKGLTDFILVSEEEIAEAIRLLLKTTHNLAEGAGAVGLAGLRKHTSRLRNKTVAIVISGSNIDQPTLQRVLRPPS